MVERRLRWQYWTVGHQFSGKWHEQWRDGALEVEEDHVLHIGLYFRNELLLLLERAGFSDVAVQGDHNDAEPTSDDDFLVFVAKR